MRARKLRTTLACGLLAAALSATTAQAGVITYVSATWGDNAVHILDANLNNLFSFAAGSTNPNGIATDGNLIWTAHFTTQEVIAYDFSGVQQFSWAATTGLQGLEYISTDEMALFTSGPNINFYHPLSGAFVRSFAAVAGTVEGLAWDGQYLWQLETNLIYATSIVDGSVFFTLPNAAGGAPFGGTGIANSGPNTLTLAGADGNWWTVSKTDGSVISSGNNGLPMYGLAFVPSPGAIGLIGVAGLLGRRRRRRR